MGKQSQQTEHKYMAKLGRKLLNILFKPNSLSVLKKLVINEQDFIDP